MSIFFNNLKRIFRKRVNLIVMLVVPIAFIAIIAGAMNSSSSSNINIGFVDNDNTKLTAILKEDLQKQGTVKPISEADIKDMIVNKKIDTAIVIPKDFTSNIIEGKVQNSIEIYSIKGTSNNSSIEYYVNSFSEAAKNIAKAANGDNSSFYNGLSAYEKGNFSKEIKYTNGKLENETATSTELGYLVMSMIYLSTMVSTLILRDKKAGVYNRIFANGTSRASYIFQSILSFVAVMFVQIVAILMVMKYMVHSDLGPSIFNLFVVLMLLGITGVALGVAICNNAKTLSQANAVIGFVATPIIMLGGCFWPRDIMGTTLKNISNFVPTTWAMDAVSKVVSGNSLASVSKDLEIIVVFAVIFFLVSVIKKVDIAR